MKYETIKLLKEADFKFQMLHGCPTHCFWTNVGRHD